MPDECDAETGKSLWKPFVHIRDFHSGCDVGINLTTLSKIGAQVTNHRRPLTQNNGRWYEVSYFKEELIGYITYFKEELIGYVTSADLKALLPQTFRKLEEMAEEGRRHPDEARLGNDVY